MQLVLWHIQIKVYIENYTIGQMFAMTACAIMLQLQLDTFSTTRDSYEFYKKIDMVIDYKMPDFPDVYAIAMQLM